MVAHQLKVGMNPLVIPKAQAIHSKCRSTRRGASFKFSAWCVSSDITAVPQARSSPMS
jgi:hypothetical protein